MSVFILSCGHCPGHEYGHFTTLERAQEEWRKHKGTGSGCKKANRKTVIWQHPMDAAVQKHEDLIYLGKWVFDYKTKEWSKDEI